MRDRLVRGMRVLQRQVVEARYVLFILAILPIGSLATLPFDDPSTPTKWYGLLLEVIGLGAVIWGLKRLRDHFEKPPLLALSGEWFSRWRDVFGRPRTGHAAIGEAIGSDTAFGIGQVRSSAPPGATLEQQLDVVRHEIDALFRSVGQIWQHHHELSSQLSSSLKEERALREAAIARLRSHHEQASIGDFGIEMTGVFFVLFGAVLATVPEWAGYQLQWIGNATICVFSAVAGLLA
jgi:hypothetical protein